MKSVVDKVFKCAPFELAWILRSQSRPPLGEEIFVTEPYERSANVSKVQISETTTLDLKHTPQ